MKISLLTLADAANSAPEGKLNVLGMGVRIIRRGNPGRVIVPMVVVAVGEATDADLGERPIDLSVTAPSGKSTTLLTDTLEITPNDPGRIDLPNEVRVQIAMPFILEEAGTFTLRMRLAGAKASYRFQVLPEGE